MLHLIVSLKVEKTGRRLLNPQQSPGGHCADSKAITKSSQGSLISSDDVKSLSSVIHLSDDSSMYCHAHSKDFLTRYFVTR